jgi:hypothetical protein
MEEGRNGLPEWAILLREALKKELEKQEKKKK